MGRFKHGDYKERFRDVADELIEENIKDRNERMKRIEQLVTEYVFDTGEKPDSGVLDKLANYILREELTDPRKNKSRIEEYPFFSEYQLARRENRELPEKAAAHIGTDGKNYRVPKRKKRSVRDMLHVDRHAKSRNKERRKKYREFTSVQPIDAFNLNELPEGHPLREKYGN